MEICERVTGYSDKMMFDRCNSFLTVMKKKYSKKVGRGRNTKIMQFNKYSNLQDRIEVMERSAEYYKKKMEKKGITLRDYQKMIVKEASEILFKSGFVYLAMEVRTGKTLTSMSVASLMKMKKVLFVTKKKALSNIQSDYELLSPDYEMEAINYESIHKVEDVHTFDMIILDEAHGMGAFPKPSNRAKAIKEIMKNSPYVILLSGTPTPESYCQIYHQVYGLPKNPFSSYKNFYRFCDDYVNVTSRKINGLMIKDYSDGKPEIMEKMKPYTINYSQKDAGFKSNINEHIIEVEMEPVTYSIAKKLKKDLVIEGRDEIILADTPVKLMSKLHQIYSGTVKFESGNSKVLDLSKAKLIHDNFFGHKIGIFYKFAEELNALKEVFGDEALTTDLKEFNETDKSIALQIVAGREGISLKLASALVYFNIDFSATSYWQSRDRMTTKDTTESDVYWIFAKNGIERDIYKSVVEKKNYTLSQFKSKYVFKKQ